MEVQQKSAHGPLSLLLHNLSITNAHTRSRLLLLSRAICLRFIDGRSAEAIVVGLIFISILTNTAAMNFDSLKDQVSNLTLYDVKAGIRKVQNGMFGHHL